jgi:hypothetical protein
MPDLDIDFENPDCQQHFYIGYNCLSLSIALKDIFVVFEKYDFNWRVNWNLTFDFKYRQTKENVNTRKTISR